jgi:hypothetical protein
MDLPIYSKKSINLGQTSTPEKLTGDSKISTFLILSSDPATCYDGKVRRNTDIKKNTLKYNY